MDKVVIKLLKQAELLPVRANAVLVIHVYQATKRKVECVKVGIISSNSLL